VTVAAAETAYAKINLALHVRRRREDGYHEIETVFAFCGDGDVVTAAPARDLTLEIEGPFAEGLSATDNLVLDAARCFSSRFSLKLTKNLPVASGIGGGSADAAATLRLLSRLTGEPLPPVEIQRALGADVPACVVSQSRRGTGVGEVLESISPVTGLSVLLVNPLIALSTAAVFRTWDAIDRGPLDNWRTGRNDLESPAKALVPVIGELIDWLEVQPGTMLARMSGSGATCFALFSEDWACAEAAAEARRLFPAYWVMESVLR
jgi:4-diphosphocytidyl-2-C-methyl-D-erythritol kinase